MKRFTLVAVGLLFFSQEAAGQASWSQIGATAPPQNTAALVAAGDMLMNSQVGAQFPGQLLLQTNVADGNNPATHTWVPIYESAAQREAWIAKLQGTATWSQFLWTVQQLSEPASTILYRTVWSAADVNDTDMVWAAHSFSVDDPAAFLAAVQAFLASPTGKKFTGQVHVSSVVAGGLTPVTTVISAGYASEAEMEAWIDVRNGTADWATYVEASGKVSEFLGTSLARTVKRWGSATLNQLTD